MLRRAREDVVAVQERGKLADDARHAPLLLRGHGIVRAAQRRRQRAFESDAEGHDVVLCDPPAQSEHWRIEHRRVVRDRRDRLRRDAFALSPRTDDDPDFFPVAKGNEHSRPGVERLASVFHRVRECPKERQWQRDVDEHGGR